MKNLNFYEWAGVTAVFIAIFLSFPKTQSIAKQWLINYSPLALFTTPTPDNIPTTATSANKIKVALLLDTSNSMDGLIEQAKSQLWKIVGALANVEN